VRFGIRTRVWASLLRDSGVLEIAERVRGLGFDVLEVCIRRPLDATGDVPATAGPAFLRESTA
jgi:hypothetical protein